MENVWLSSIGYQVNKLKTIHEAATNSYKKGDDDEEMPEDDAEMPEDDKEEEPEDKLNDRQKMMYGHYEHVVEQYGKFNQSAKANGAHYAPADENPFKDAGMVCGNCIYFIGGGACEIVSGKIEPMAICKLWIIPEELIKQ
jgi:hypothetical protein